MNRTYREILDSAAGLRVGDDLNLFPSIAARLERRTFMQTLRARPVLAVLLVLLALSFLTGIVYAVGRSLGYIPGVGLVEQATSIRVLSAPVSITRDNITLTVTQSVLTSDKTVVAFALENVPWDALSHDENVPGCSGVAELHLPDGTVMHITEGGSAMGTTRFVYAPLPADVNEATFVLPCIQDTLPGKAPENWEVPLRFIPAPADITIVPVTEIPTPTPQPQATTAPMPVSLENTMLVGNQYILLGRLDGQSGIELTGYQLTDASGEVIPASPPTLQGLPNFDWGLQFKASDVTYPVTITLAGRNAAVMPDATADFVFDAGEDPQPGQEWTFNQPLRIGETTVTLTTIQVDSRGGYSFNFETDSDVKSLEVEILGYQAAGGGGGGAQGHFSTSLAFAQLPTGKLQIHLSHLALYSPVQTWQIQWSPETVTSTQTVPISPDNGACLTFNDWQQLVSRNDPVPSGVRGKIITTVNEGGLLPAIYISGLDGVNPQKIVTASWPSLSTDGMRMAYSAGDGLHILDLATGQNIALGIDGYRIIWSPDSTRLMFTNTFNLYVVNGDGSGLERIDTSPAQVISSVGWPDNQTVVYGLLGTGGFTLKSYDLQSGHTDNLFTVHNKAGYGAISPDGEWIVFADRLSVDAINWGIYISRLDGSQRKLIAEPEVPTSFTSIWGPDGQWLILNTQYVDNLTKEERKMAVLVNPFTCQTVYLSGINGVIEGWSP